MKADDKLRERAREHLKKILKATALGGAALGFGTACESCHPMVCDPLPPPLCASTTSAETFHNSVQEGATWQLADGGALVVSAAVSVSSYSSPEKIRITAAPSLVGATLLQVDHPGDGVAFTFAPDAAATQVTANIPVDCNGTAKTIVLSIDVTAPAAGKALAISFVTQ